MNYGFESIMKKLRRKEIYRREGRMTGTRFRGEKNYLRGRGKEANKKKMVYGC